MTVRLAISVEGPTEYEFCREVIRPHLQAFGVWAEPKIVVTKRNIAGPNAKGGSVSMDRVVAEVTPLLYSFDHVTTLYDYYGFRGRAPGESADDLCRRMAAQLGNPHCLFPYVQVHEFEALLFSSPDTVGRFLGCPPVATVMNEAVAACGSAEQVNDSPVTAPSKRMEKAFADHVGQRYDKKFHGPLLLMEMGLPVIRAACPRFNGWLTQLEQLGGNA